MKHRVAAVFLTVCLLLSLLAVPAAAAGRYSDVPEGDWAAEVIEKATEYGLIQGKGDGTFGYGEYMNRASFVTVLCRMFGWEMVSPEKPSFSDCPPGEWYYSAVETALANGAIDSGLYFRPDDDISRQDMAVMLVRALGYENLALTQASAELPFADVTENRGYLALAYEFGVINGVAQADGSLLFLPGHSSTRQEAAAMLVRVYEKYHADIEFLHGFYAMSSYGQIDMAGEMDAVSLGWARMSLDESGTPYVNQSASGGNEWAVPQGAELATDALEEAGVDCNLSVYAAGSDLTAILSAGNRQTAVEQLVRAAGDYVGLTIDFEGLGASLRTPFTQFMTALRAALPEEKALWVCVQPDEWYGGYDYRALGEICGKVILMAHDYQDTNLPQGWVGTSQTRNAPAPINKVYEALRAITDPDTGVADTGKIALAVSISSVGLKVDENGLLASTDIYTPAPDTLAARMEQSDAVRTWDAAAATPYLTYSADGEHYKVWYEDAQSIMAKVNLAHMFGVDGLSIWRLGIIPNYADTQSYDVWSAVQTQRTGE